MNTILPTIMSEHLKDPAPTEQMRGLGRERDLSPDKEWQSAKQFEAYFLSFIYSQVKENSSDSEAEGDGQQSKMFQSMFFQEIGNKATQGGKSMGIADQIYRQMTGSYHSEKQECVSKDINNANEAKKS